MNDKESLRSEIQMMRKMINRITENEQILTSDKVLKISTQLDEIINKWVEIEKRD